MTDLRIKRTNPVENVIDFHEGRFYSIKPKLSFLQILKKILKSLTNLFRNHAGG